MPLEKLPPPLSLLGCVLAGRRVKDRWIPNLPHTSPTIFRLSVRWCLRSAACEDTPTPTPNPGPLSFPSFPLPPGCSGLECQVSCLSEMGNGEVTLRIPVITHKLIFTHTFTPICITHSDTTAFFRFQKGPSPGAEEILWV